MIVRPPTPFALRRPRAACGLALVASLLCGLGPEAQSDEFRLTGGGCIRGQWLNSEQQPVVEYVVRTEQGIVVWLAPEQVQEAIGVSPAKAEYLRREPLAANTADAQFELSQWCREKGLSAERQKHLARALELDTHHQLARRALGYHFLNGQWVLPKDQREAEGYVYYRGRWRTPQDVDSIEAQAKLELAQKEWLVKLRRWRNDLNTERAKLAAESFAALRDPVAVKPLGTLLSGEGVRSIKIAYCDILANIQSGESIGILVSVTLNDPDPEMFHHALDKLVRIRPANIIDPYLAALSDTSNARVQRAAQALGRFKDPSSISPLIDALRTKHLQVVGGNNPFDGLDSQTFAKSSTDAPGSFGNAAVSRGDNTKMVVVGIDNDEVLTALTKITGTSFGFDQRAWRLWHAQEKKRQSAATLVQRRE